MGKFGFWCENLVFGNNFEFIYSAPVVVKGEVQINYHLALFFRSEPRDTGKTVDVRSCLKSAHSLTSVSAQQLVGGMQKYVSFLLNKQLSW